MINETEIQQPADTKASATLVLVIPDPLENVERIASTRNAIGVNSTTWRNHHVIIIMGQNSPAAKTKT